MPDSAISTNARKTMVVTERREWREGAEAARNGPDAKRSIRAWDIEDTGNNDRCTHN